jgi:hypothetical protein
LLWAWLIRPLTVDCDAIKAIFPIGLADGDALTEPRDHVVSYPLLRAHFFHLLVCSANYRGPFSVGKERRGNSIVRHELRILLALAFYDPRDYRKYVCVFPGNGHLESCHLMAVNAIE